MGLVGWCRRIIALEWLFLVFLLPVIILPSNVTYLALLVIPILWLLRKLAHGHFVPETPLDISILALLLMVLVSLSVTFSVMFSAPRIASLLYGVAVYYAAVAAAGRSWGRLVAGSGFLLACGLIVVVISLFGTRWGFVLPGISQLSGNLPLLRLFPGVPEGFNPNQVAGTLLWTAPLLISTTVAGLHQGKKLVPGMARRPRRLLVILTTLLLVIVVAALVLTRSRSALIGLSYAVLFMGLVARRYAWPVVAGGILALSIAIAGVLLLLGSPDGPVPPGKFAGIDLGASSQIDSPVNLQGRIEIWSRALYGIEDFPFAGMGIGAFRKMAPVIYPFFQITPDVDIGHAHNLFLQAALDLGLPGLIAYLALWLGSGAMWWRTWRLAVPIQQRVLALGFGGALVGYFVYGLTDAVAIGAKPAFIFWLLLGLLASQHKMIQRSLRANL